MTRPKPSPAPLFGRHRGVRRGLWAFHFLCLLLLLLDLTNLRHGTHPIDGWWSFYGLFGFVACVALVLVAKQLRRWLMRNEDYYDRD